MKNKHNSTKKGFTLVEILIVVALIAILAVVALITINPAEAQRRARDTQRLKDMATLQSIVEQYLSDNPVAFTSAGWYVTSEGGSNLCGTAGWFGTDVCAYANTMPIDPVNRSTIVANTSTVDVEAVAAYQVNINQSGQYRICLRLESEANVPKLTSDGGATTGSNDYFEIFSSTSAPICNN